MCVLDIALSNPESCGAKQFFIWSRTFQPLRQLDIRGDFASTKALWVHILSTSSLALPFLYILPNIFRYKEARGFHSHTYFINFDQYGVDESIQPTLINMIRKPVSMQVSRIFWDYYLEHGQDPEKLKQNFNLTQCLIRNQYYCRFQATQLQICFFAGSGPPCSHVKIEDGEVNEVLQLAKYNVERHYAVVGLTERLNETLVLLEAYLPRFFRGISAIYKESDGIAINVRPFEAAASQLEQNLIRDHPMIRMELDFYDFVKQRFDKQFAYISGAYKTPLLMKIWGYIFSAELLLYFMWKLVVYICDTDDTDSLSYWYGSGRSRLKNQKKSS